jgi:hypothetical protein
MSYSSELKNNMQYIGKLVFSEDSIKFNTPNITSTGRINQKHFIELGDIVYSLYCGDTLMKIGKAAGSSGWYGRVREYTKKRYNKNNKDTWDQTTTKMYNHMSLIGHTELLIYAVQSPRIEHTLTSICSGKTYIEQIETAGGYEQILIQEAMLNGETLPLCREIIK